MTKKLIIAVDGYSSCGKSTLARQLAEKLTYVYIDTGAMYRAITLYLLRNGIDENDEKSLSQALLKIKLGFKNTEDGNEIYLNDENVNCQIRQMDVSDKVSFVAAIAQVRIFAVEAQRAIGRAGGVVMDGRDIGTSVFPNADLKIFMTASLEVRVQRRYDELKASGTEVTWDEVSANLEKRDYLDTHREISPLRQAEDAKVLDNSDLNREEQLKIAYQWALELLNS